MVSVTRLQGWRVELPARIPFFPNNLADRYQLVGRHWATSDANRNLYIVNELFSSFVLVIFCSRKVVLPIYLFLIQRESCFQTTYSHSSFGKQKILVGKYSLTSIWMLSLRNKNYTSKFRSVHQSNESNNSIQTVPISLEKSNPKLLDWVIDFVYVNPKLLGSVVGYGSHNSNNPT